MKTGDKCSAEGNTIWKMIREEGWMTARRERFLILVLPRPAFTINFVFFLLSSGSRARPLRMWNEELT